MGEILEGFMFTSHKFFSGWVESVCVFVRTFGLWCQFIANHLRLGRQDKEINLWIVYTHSHTHSHSHTHTHTHTRTHSLRYAHVHAHTCMYMYITVSCAHTHTHAYAHVHVHVHVHVRCLTRVCIFYRTLH